MIGFVVPGTGKLVSVMDREALGALRQAVQASPDNLPLRRHPADRLLGAHRSRVRGEPRRPPECAAP